MSDLPKAPVPPLTAPSLLPEPEPLVSPQLAGTSPPEQCPTDRDGGQEVDVWWGSYSPWTMLPSLAMCIGLSGLIAWGAWLWLDRGWTRFTVLSLTGLLWSLQTGRWCHRVFGYNYRFTTHRLFALRGLFASEVEVRLTAVTKVLVKRKPTDRLVGVGNLHVFLEGVGRSRVVLEGVARPRQVAEHLRQIAAKAREVK